MFPGAAADMSRQSLEREDAMGIPTEILEYLVALGGSAGIIGASITAVGSRLIHRRRSSAQRRELDVKMLEQQDRVLTMIETAALDRPEAAESLALLLEAARPGDRVVRRGRTRRRGHRRRSRRRS
jgi:hypothetical protein